MFAHLLVLSGCFLVDGYNYVLPASTAKWRENWVLVRAIGSLDSERDRELVTNYLDTNPTLTPGTTVRDAINRAQVLEILKEATERSRQEVLTRTREWSTYLAIDLVAVSRKKGRGIGEFEKYFWDVPALGGASHCGMVVPSEHLTNSTLEYIGLQLELTNNSDGVLVSTAGCLTLSLGGREVCRFFGAIEPPAPIAPGASYAWSAAIASYGRTRPIDLQGTVLDAVWTPKSVRLIGGDVGQMIDACQ